MLINTALADGNETINIQETESIPNKPQSTESILTSLVPMVLIFFVFYFLLIRPQEKRRKRQEAFVKGVKVGEEVMTNSGIFGKVTKINDSDNVIFLKVADNVEVKMLKTSIADITSRSESKDSKSTDKKVKEDKKIASKKAN